MILNDFQKIDISKALEKFALLMTHTDYSLLDIKGIDNRIQQALGVINFLDSLDLDDDHYKKQVAKILKSLYQRKKELMYGYDESQELKVLAANY